MRQLFSRRTLLAGLTALAAMLAAPQVLALPVGAPSPDSPEFPKWVMDYVDDVYRGRQSHGVFEMKVKTKHWTRTMALEQWSLGTEYSIVRILAPKKERGSATLKAKDDLFTYLNKTGRTIKISGAMMGGAWMGSHFTNDDLVKDSRLSKDYTIKKTFSGRENGVEVHRFTATPRPEAPVVWGKIEISVRADDLQPVSQVFFDEDGEKVRILEFLEHRELGGRLMPTRMMMRPLDKPNEFTQVTWKKADFEVKLDKGFFSLQRLKSM